MTSLVTMTLLGEKKTTQITNRAKCLSADRGDLKPFAPPTLKR